LLQETLFFIEGTDGQALNWGDGFRLVPVNATETSPKDFFDALVSQPYAKNVIISPHVYPASVNQYTWKWLSSTQGHLDDQAVPTLLAK